MAAPMVSAAAAMLYSQFPDATLADVKDILLSSVQKLDSLTGLTATGGMLDLGAAMASGAAAQKGRTWTEPDRHLAGAQWRTLYLLRGGPGRQ